jgi:hypothetical protein
MRWRVAVMIAMAVVLGAGALFCIVQSSALSSAGQRVYQDVSQNGPTIAQQEAANQAFQASSALQVLSTPLVVGSLLAVIGVVMVLTIRWQRLRPRAPAR